jgi:primase-polymerase (primpol)-like protein
MAKPQARPYKAIILLAEPNARLVGVGEESFVIAGRKHTLINQPTCKMLREKGWVTESAQDASGVSAAVLTDTGRGVAARIAAAAGKYRQIYAPWAEESDPDGSAEEELAALASDGKEAEPPSPQRHPTLPPPREESTKHATASEELQQRPQWVNWTAEPRRDGIAKPPYQTGSDSRASTSDPATWGTCQDALKAVERGQHTGIGYVFSEDDPYTGIDLDKCRYPPTGRIAPWALRIVQRFNSYTEISPSGTGLHIFVRGTLPGHAHRRDQVEAYSCGQYFTWTGDHLPGTPETIEACQEQLNELSGWLSATPRKEQAPPDRHPKNSPSAPPLHQRARKESTVGGMRRPRTDDEILAVARRSGNATQFCRLYDTGDTGEHPSPSEADFTLCLLLCYWTDGDAGQMDRLFRRSALMGGKWDRRSGHDSDGHPVTYGQRTIAAAREIGNRISQTSAR